MSSRCAYGVSRSPAARAPPCCIRTAARIRAYDVAMTDLPVIADERGVDVSQIRRQLALPVPERVRVMVEAANTMIAMADHAQRGCGSLQASPSMRANPRS